VDRWRSDGQRTAGKEGEFRAEGKPALAQRVLCARQEVASKYLIPPTSFVRRISILLSNQMRVQV
jgi:hypothetical protein